MDPLELTSFYPSQGTPGADELTYTRLGNGTWTALEEALGKLEEARATVFASGMAATFATMLALTYDRARVVLPSDGYHGVRELAHLLAGRGLEPTFVDQADLAAVGAALANAPSVLWCESPTNPFLRVMDLSALAELAARHDAPLVVDNTIATAALQRPLEFGATATVTSLTKGTSGHSDVVLGSVATRDRALRERLLTWRAQGGGIAGPFEAWLALRGLKTLTLRARRQSETAAALVSHLARHPRVLRVHYPGHDPRTRALAERQMPAGYGPLLSFELAGGAAAADRAVAASRLIQPGTSFGGVESSWERRARWPAEKAPPGLIRLSVGLEDARELAADLDRALEDG